MASAGKAALALFALMTFATSPGAEALASFLTRHLHSGVAGASCAKLTNAGTHFTVKVAVGTPSQEFDVVADTGSNSLIIPSCLCQTQGHCPKTDHCFTGTHKSSSFKLYQTEKKETENLVISFGSGKILGVVAMDQVKVGPKGAFMQDGFLLMLDRALDLSGPFEGILGLGVPRATEGDLGGDEQGNKNKNKDDNGEVASLVGGKNSMDTVVQDLISQILQAQQNTVGGAAIVPVVPGQHLRGGVIEVDIARSPQVPRSAARAQPALKHPTVKSYLEQANVKRFSMCFGKDEGALRLNVPADTEALDAVGQSHWGLSLEGVSLGSGTKLKGKMSFCNRTEMDEDQETPCGVIPDSGTTLIMAPSKSLNVLFENLCDSWDRCKSNHTALLDAAEAAHQAAVAKYNIDPFDVKSMVKTGTKAQVLQFLLNDCASWAGDSGLEELPDINFHVAGKSGKAATLTLKPKEWVLALEDPESKETMCSPAFSVMEYPTQLNGDVWILGTPLFYAYNVIYDVESSPPSMGFTSTKEDACTACASAAGLVSMNATKVEANTHMKATSKLRRLHGAPRNPNIDVSQPL